jgi:hypothetical protein
MLAALNLYQFRCCRKPDLPIADFGLRIYIALQSAIGNRQSAIGVCRLDHARQKAYSVCS